MSLFACSECGIVENTALGDYHMRSANGYPPLCSQCSPAIGKWHGQFPRRTPEECGYIEVTEGTFKGTLEPPGGWG